MSSTITHDDLKYQYKTIHLYESKRILTNKGRHSYVSILTNLSLNRFANMQTTRSTISAISSAHDFQQEDFLAQLLILNYISFNNSPL